MKICTLASSSSGNCTIVSNGQTHILIDAGISLRRITKSLGCLGLSPGDLSGVLITHEHSDHINGLKMLLKYHKTPVFAPAGAGKGLCQGLPEASGCISFFQAGSELVFGDMTVKSFKTPHDTPESVGYRFDSGQSVFVFVTDLGCVTTAVMDAVRGADMAVIEANHDVDMLKNGIYPYYLKRRILSEHGHLSNMDSGYLAARLTESGTKRIVLAHLSKENNTPVLARETVCNSLTCIGAVAGRDMELAVAPADEPGDLYII
jgi:phosphoribosyl 1,2-cyclic phosphodiesterase